MCAGTNSKENGIDSYRSIHPKLCEEMPTGDHGLSQTLTDHLLCATHLLDFISFYLYLNNPSGKGVISILDFRKR